MLNSSESPETTTEPIAPDGAEKVTKSMGRKKKAAASAPAPEPEQTAAPAVEEPTPMKTLIPDAPKSTSAYFKELFEANPAWLEGRDNTPLLEAYKRDYSVEDVPQNVKQSLSVLKSKLRSDKRGGTAPKKKKVKTSAHIDGTPVRVYRKDAGSADGLEGLEVTIDDALAKARQLDADGQQGLIEVIKLLRIARARTVMAGETT